jgi:hypothetical protein
MAKLMSSASLCVRADVLCRNWLKLVKLIEGESSVSNRLVEICHWLGGITACSCLGHTVASLTTYCTFWPASDIPLEQQKRRIRIRYFQAALLCCTTRRLSLDLGDSLIGPSSILGLTYRSDSKSSLLSKSLSALSSTYMSARCFGHRRAQH